MTKALITTILHKRVSIRRSGRVIGGILTQSLISEIKQGRLKKDDEISPDEKSWVRLDQHHQLAKYFQVESSFPSEKLPSDMDRRLIELSKILKELSQ